jgi:hypothetical protein
MPSTIIALGYRARSGKDTVGDYLVSKWGFKRIAFADKLKQVVTTLTGQDAFDPDFKHRTQVSGLTGGQVLQQVGVALRGVHDNIWVDASGLSGFAMMPGARIVITDCRFKNEAAAVKRLGGHLVEVRRPGLPDDSHSSEVGGTTIKWDRVLHNNSTLTQLYVQADALVADILGAAQRSPQAIQIPEQSR